MERSPFKAKTLSALLFCLGAGHVASAQNDVRLQALSLLKENRISYDEFRQLVAEPEGGGISGSYVSSGNYASYVSSGNYADYISAGNYADYISEGNYANYVSEANYGSAMNYGENLENLPVPSTDLLNK